jgi:hypothetical protein
MHLLTIGHAVYDMHPIQSKDSVLHKFRKSLQVQNYRLSINSALAAEPLECN